MCSTSPGTGWMITFTSVPKRSSSEARRSDSLTAAGTIGPSQGLRGSGGTGVGADDDRLDALIDEKPGDLQAPIPHELARLVAPRRVGRIGDVVDRLPGQGGVHLAQNGEPTHTRIEDADRPLVHGQRLMRAAGVTFLTFFVTIGRGRAFAMYDVTMAVGRRARTVRRRRSRPVEFDQVRIERAAV